RPSRTPAARRRARRCAISCSREIGQTPACRRRSKVPFDRGIVPPRPSHKASSRIGPHMHMMSDSVSDSRDPALEDHMAPAPRALREPQAPEGHGVFELEADSTIPPEYTLMRHSLAEPVDAELERKIGVYLRRVQGAHGGWPLFHAGPFDMS